MGCWRSPSDCGPMATPYTPRTPSTAGPSPTSTTGSRTPTPWAETFAALAAEFVSGMGLELVYGGMSMGAALAAEQVLARPGARGAFFPYGAIAPSWWEATWPAGVPAQAHLSEADPWRELEAEEEYVA